MAFNPFNLFKGNPRVLEMMNAERGLDQLLLEQSFVSEFKKSDNEALQAYMNYQRYTELINYITTIDCNDNDKNRAYKFPYVASEILAVNNELTFKFLLEEVVFTEEQIEEETEVEKEIDSESSDRSYSSIKSNNSATPKKEPMESKTYAQADKENFVLREEGDKALSEMDWKEINEDDFPDVKQKKVVVVRELVKRTVKRPYQPLVFKLLRFFSSEVVHILDGYVCRVLDSIVNNRLEAFLTIVDKYDAFNQLKRVFAHLQSTSVQEFVLNFITRLQESDSTLSLAQELRFIQFIQRICEIHWQEWPEQQTVLEQKAYILSLYCSILEKINTKLNNKLNPDGQKPQQNPPILNELKEMGRAIRKQHISKLIDTLNAIATLTPAPPLLAKIVLHYARLAKLLLKGYSIAKSAQGRHNSSEEQALIKQMVQTCEDCFDPVIPSCFSFVFEDYLQLEREDQLRFKGRNSLLAKMEFVEVLGLLAKENIYFARRTIIDHPSFPYLLQIMGLHPNSSILHNALLAILTPFFSTSNEALLIEKLFQKEHFFASLFQIVKADSELRYEKKERTRKCYIAQITSLCLAIQNLHFEENQSLNQYKQSYQWQFIHQCLIEDERGLRKKVLGGHQKLRDRKPLIFFTKEECLDHYRHFLSGSKLSLFEDFDNYEPGNSDSEDEKERQERQKAEFSTESTRIDTPEEEKLEQTPEDDSKYFAEDVTL